MALGVNISQAGQFEVIVKEEKKPASKKAAETVLKNKPISRATVKKTTKKGKPRND